MMNVVVIGGAGFIGSNAADFYCKQGNNVTILDNFSRKGNVDNISWLLKNNKKNLNILQIDIRYQKEEIKEIVKKADIVLHLAAQVAVTTSVNNPQEDFETNAIGTFNILEAIRSSENNPILIYSSTNKVYGGLEHLKTVEKKNRYSFINMPYGISEEQNLDFHSPYGCSKGAADQYVHDYARIYNLRTVVFRQSCIYGPRQFGIEDQGWLAWFIIALVKQKAITIYGTGKQVRDILYIDDLIHAYDLAIQQIDKTEGEVYNIGGGIKNTLSVWYEFVPILEKKFGRKIEVQFADERPGDQPIYVSDIRKAKKDFGWKPVVSVDKGIERLYQWVIQNENLFI